MKHKVGDKVKIRKNLKANVNYGTTVAVEEMVELAGKTATIECVNEDCYGDIFYHLEEDKNGWYWTDDMFEDAVTNADKIRNMSDEELAEFLINVVRHKVCNYISEDVCHGNKCEFCEGFLWWLQQPTNL